MNRKVWDCDRQGQATHIFLYTSILGVGNRAVIAGVAGARRPREQCARVDEERPRQRPRSSTDADLGKKPAAEKVEVIDLTG